MSNSEYKHPSGVEVHEITGYFSGNLASVWELMWADVLYAPFGDVLRVDRALERLDHEIKRRRGLILNHSGKTLPEAPATIKSLNRRVLKVFQHESGSRQQLFSALWDAHKDPTNIRVLNTAIAALQQLKEV